jgi:MFS transporter, DHA3 family, tetracycline resistance protein
VFGMNLLYQTSVVGLDPLQLVLVGTVLEATVFIFEIPTGALADLVSRKLSIVLGHALLGAGFVLQGVVPSFGVILAAQVVCGLGYTFTSGATQAWLADEVGAARATALFARGAQLAQAGALAGIAASTVLGAMAVRLPILCGGVAMMALAAALAPAMAEHRRARERAGGGIAAFGDLLRQAARLAATSRTIRLLLLLALSYGLASEGIDRLWTARLLRNFAVIGESPWSPALWFGGAAAVFQVLGVASTGLATSVVSRATRPAAFLLGAFVLIIAMVAVAALDDSFWVAFAAFAVLAAARAAVEPLRDGLMNGAITDSRVRATLFSAAGQADAVGQVAGGPVSGVAGRLWSVRAGLLASALLLLPAPVAVAALLPGRPGRPGRPVADTPPES